VIAYEKNTGLYIYVDSVQIDNNNAGNFDLDDPHDNYKFLIGMNYDIVSANLTPFTGHIYEIRLYGTQLDALGVWKDYNPCIIDTQFWSYMECIDICSGT
jgi:hypothetical protein